MGIILEFEENPKNSFQGMITQLMRNLEYIHIFIWRNNPEMQGCQRRIWIYPLFDLKCSKNIQFCWFWSTIFNFYPIFGYFWPNLRHFYPILKNTKSSKKSVSRLIFGIPTTLAALLRCPHIEHLKNCNILYPMLRTGRIATQFGIKLNLPIIHIPLLQTTLVAILSMVPGSVTML